MPRFVHSQARLSLSLVIEEASPSSTLPLATQRHSSAQAGGSGSNSSRQSLSSRGTSQAYNARAAAMFVGPTGQDREQHRAPDDRTCGYWRFGG